MRRVLATFSIVGIAGLLAILSGCSTDEQNGMTITTSSETARKNYLQGRELSEKLRHTEAAEYFQKAVAEDSNFAMAWIAMAQLRGSGSDYRQNVDRAIALKDQVSEGERLCILALEAGMHADQARAEEYLQQLVDAFPGDARTHNLLGNSYFAQQKNEKAVEEFLLAIDVAPEYSPTYNMLGYTYRSLGRLEESKDAFARYIELMPDDANPYDSYAELLMKMGKFEESIENYQKALTINPKFYYSHIGIATNLVFMGEYEKAREQLRKMYAATDDNFQRREFHYAQAVTYLAEDEVDKALRELDRRFAVAESSEDVIAMAGDLMLAGHILREIGQLDEAADMYKDAMKLIKLSDLDEPRKKNSKRNHLYNTCRLALLRGNLSEARSKAEYFRTEVENAGSALLIQAAFSLAGQIALAERDYDQAIELFLQANMQRAFNMFELAQAYEGKGDKKKAREMYQQVAEFNQLNSVDYTLVRNKAREMMTLM